jgi:hypothetical protein
VLVGALPADARRIAELGPAAAGAPRVFDGLADAA